MRSKDGFFLCGLVLCISFLGNIQFLRGSGAGNDFPNQTWAASLVDEGDGTDTGFENKAGQKGEAHVSNATNGMGGILSIDAEIRIEPLSLHFDFSSSNVKYLQTSSAGPVESANTPVHSEYYYYYFGERRPLQLDLQRIAVREDRSALAALQKYGIRPDEGERIFLPGWHLVSLNLPATEDADMESVIAQMAENPSLDFISPVFVGSDGGHIVLMPEIFVGFQEDLEPKQMEQIISASELMSVLALDYANMKNVCFLNTEFRNGFDVLRAANALAALTEVRFAEPNMLFRGEASLLPNDPAFSQCWGIHNTGQSGGIVDMDMDGPEAWEFEKGDSSVTVVVIDNGVQQDHPDLNQRPGTDTTNDADSIGDGGPVNSYDNHGTAVSGCISAILNNETGVVGIAPECKIASARAHIAYNNQRITVSSGWVINALSWAESIGARVTNNSNIYSIESSALAAKYEQTRNSGIIHFAAAGNDPAKPVAFPAKLPSVNAVGGLNRYGDVSSHSTGGSELAYVAPGEWIHTTDRTGSDGYGNGDYATFNGTSFASAYAAGVAALILSVDSTLTSNDVEAILEDSCTDLGILGYDTDFGFGFVNAFEAVKSAGQTQSFTIFNDGSETLSITSIEKEQGSEWLRFYPSAPIDIPSESSRTMNVFVDRNRLRDVFESDRLLVHSNDLEKSPYPGGVEINVSVGCAAPQVTQEPADVIIGEGEDALFMVVVAGNPPLHYQWKLNGAEVGQDSPLFTLAGVRRAGDGAQISCEVSNLCGSAVSRIASLTVVFCPEDLDGDGDVDGLDRALFGIDANGLSVDEFIAQLGRDDCHAVP
jgi:hypothetical protein